jgi:hypothetical protein
VLDKLAVSHKHATNGMEAWTRLSGMAAHAQQTGISVLTTRSTFWSTPKCRKWMATC